ncbi:MAG: hypothetical protein AAF645_22240, partial [Myxococcota bacterium]
MVVSARFLLFSMLIGLVGCGGESTESSPTSESSDGPSLAELENVSEAAANEATRRALEEALNRDFPLHGLITRTSLQVRAEASP